MEVLSSRNLASKYWVRAGMIPYVEQNGQFLFGFAIDATYQGLTDFGGHRDPGDSDILETIMREVNEETYGTFNFITEEDLLESLSFAGDNGTLEVLVFMNENPSEITNRLMKKLDIHQKRGEVLESIGITWIPRDQLLDILNLPPDIGNKIMYSKVLNPLRQAIDYI